jgi:hypothetical protein
MEPNFYLNCSKFALTVTHVPSFARNATQRWLRSKSSVLGQGNLQQLLVPARSVVAMQLWTKYYGNPGFFKKYFIKIVCVNRTKAKDDLAFS